MMGEKDVNPIFRLPRLPKEVMLTNSLWWSCLVDEELIGNFCKDLVDQWGQRDDDNSSKGSTVIKPASSIQNN